MKNVLKITFIIILLSSQCMLKADESLMRQVHQERRELQNNHPALIKHINDGATAASIGIVAYGVYQLCTQPSCFAANAAVMACQRQGLEALTYVAASFLPDITAHVGLNLWALKRTYNNPPAQQ